MTAEEMADTLASAHDGSEAKWTEINRVRQCYLEMHAHFIRQKEDLAITVDELADLEALYDALLGVRPRRGGTPAPAAGSAEPAGGAPARRRGRPRNEAPKPPGQAQEPGEEAARQPDMEGP